MSDELAFLRVTAQHLGISTDAYRVSWGHDLHVALRALRCRKWGSAWWYIKGAVSSLWDGSSWAPWQCESNAYVSARRGLTARSAELRMLRDAVDHALGSECSAARYACRFHPVRPRDRT